LDDAGKYRGKPQKSLEFTQICLLFKQLQDSMDFSLLKSDRLLVLTASLAAFANEYMRHLQRDHPEDSAAEVRLYVKEIHTGSIVASLMAASP